jgi:hypothetical protein
MILNVKHEANWEYIHARKKYITLKNNKAGNAKRIPHTYNVSDKVLVERGTKNKYETPCQGPYIITQLNENGTVQMMIKNVEDTINIRRLTPYLDTDNIPYGGECSMHNSIGSGEQTRIESCIIRIPESMVESQHSSPN